MWIRREPKATYRLYQFQPTGRQSTQAIGQNFPGTGSEESLTNGRRPLPSIRLEFHVALDSVHNRYSDKYAEKSLQIFVLILMVKVLYFQYLFVLARNSYLEKEKNGQDVCNLLYTVLNMRFFYTDSLQSRRAWLSQTKHICRSVPNNR